MQLQAEMSHSFCEDVHCDGRYTVTDTSIRSHLSAGGLFFFCLIARKGLDCRQYTYIYLSTAPVLPRVSPPVSELILPQFRSQGRLFLSNSVSFLGPISSLLLLILWISSSTKVAILSSPQQYQLLS
jgi:hypothetical protein